MSPLADQADLQIFPDAYLRNFSAQVFIHFGVPEADATQAADVLATGDLRGIDSHGVARLHTYFDLLSVGRINPRPKIGSFARAPAPRPSTETTASGS